jgi:hypothetical protein
LLSARTLDIRYVETHGLQVVGPDYMNANEYSDALAALT